MTRRGMPRSRAISRPGAFARLLITMAISAASFRRAILLAIASKFEPRPEIRIPRRTSAVLHARLPPAMGDYFSDDPRFFAGAPQCTARGIDFQFRNHQNHAHSKVEGAPPVGFGYFADRTQHVEKGRHVPRMSVDRGGHAFRQRARKIIRNPAAGDMGGGRD